MAFASFLGDRKVPTPSGAKESLKKRPTILGNKSSRLLRPSMFFRGRSGLGSGPSTKGDAERLELDDLNESLAALSALFPDVQVEVLREMLLNTSPESRVHIVAEALLEQKATWVRGRWRSREGKPVRSKSQEYATGPERSTLPLHERFRTPEYKDAVRAAFYQEFKSLPRSTIEAVLAEHNYSYMRSRPALLSVSAGSWWYSLSTFLLRRKRSQPQDHSEHPLLIWMSTDDQDGPRTPIVKRTGSAELDQEIYDVVVAPLQQRLRQAQMAQDYDLALQINEAEAEEHDAMYDCECCFVGTTYEQLSICNQSGHWICFRCIRHATTEAIYGQSWTSNIDTERGALRCLAPSLGNEANCNGCIDHTFTRRALLEEKDGERLLRQLDDKFATEGLKISDLPLVWCPFCTYAEADNHLPSIFQLVWRRRNSLFTQNTISTFVLCIALFPILLPLALCALFLLTTHSTSTAALNHSIKRVALKRRGLKFTCSSPSCLRSSCLGCHKEWHDIHICYESERVALREHIERAMVDAIKRTCPRCHLSFVKASGCNKLTCPCGYHMCYLCRAEITDEGYRHFCEHFRPLGDGVCGECRKCDLYRAEDDDVVVTRAAKRAEKEWREQHAAEVGGGGSGGGETMDLRLDDEDGNAGWRKDRKGDYILPRPRTWTEEMMQKVGVKSWTAVLDRAVNWLMDTPP